MAQRRSSETSVPGSHPFPQKSKEGEIITGGEIREDSLEKGAFGLGLEEDKSENKENRRTASQEGVIAGAKG